MIKHNCKHDTVNRCEKCNNKSTCSLLNPTTKNHLLLINEIEYWFNELKNVRNNIKKYSEVLNDILQYHKYSITVNIYGTIKYAPKKNVFGVFIKKPEHIYYGWNYTYLKNMEKKLESRLRELNKKELNMNRIINKRSLKL